MFVHWSFHLSCSRFPHHYSTLLSSIHPKYFSKFFCAKNQIRTFLLIRVCVCGCVRVCVGACVRVCLKPKAINFTVSVFCCSSFRSGRRSFPSGSVIMCDSCVLCIVEWLWLSIMARGDFWEGKKVNHESFRAWLAVKVDGARRKYYFAVLEKSRQEIHHKAFLFFLRGIMDWSHVRWEYACVMKKCNISDNFSGKISKE